MNFDTKAIRTQTDRTQYREHSTPLFPTSSFCYESAEQMKAVFATEEEAFIYSRFSNPNSNELEMKLAALEGTESAFVTASGMAAIFACFMSFLKAGDHIIASKALFGSSQKLLSNWMTRWNIEHDLIDAAAPETWEQSLRTNTKILFVETPSNPGLEIYDLEKLSAFSKKHGILFIVDNCFATPYLQRPIEYGADLIMHSATKYLDGQGRVVAGAVCGPQDLIDEIKAFCRATGPSLSPFNAWILSKSLETLSIRMDRHCSNAEYLARELSKHPKVEKVIYPFLESHPNHTLAKRQMKLGGAIVSFTLKGELKDGMSFLNNLNLLSLTANLGDSRSIASHPASTTHSKLSAGERLDQGITDNLIRISVGLEDREDIYADILQSLNRI